MSKCIATKDVVLRRARVAVGAFVALVTMHARADEPATPPPDPPPVAEPAPAPPAPAAAPEPPDHGGAIDVRASTSIAGYGDNNHVFVFSPTIGGTIENPTAGYSVNGRYLADVVSAASADIVSTASRRWEEVRHVGTVGGTYKPNEWGMSGNADVSIEPDYQAYTFAGSVTRDLLDKNLTLLLGYELGHDISGRHGTPFSVFSRKIEHSDFKGGFTYLLDRATLVSGVADVVVETGDTSKPYRYVPMFAPGVAVPNGASVEVVNQIRLPVRVLEQLPTARTRYALAGHIAHRFDGWTLRAEERLYTDSWGLHASTTDLRLIFDLGDRVDAGPHLRFHGQTPVAFWSRAYVLRPGFDYPALRTGDRQLGPLRAYTGGAALHVSLGSRPKERNWLLGFDLNVTETRFLDDIFLDERLSVVGSVGLEARF